MRILVVGGGIAGASAGYELAVSADVVVLERETVCGYHSTGRSAALFTECYGDAVVRRMAIAARPFLTDPPPGFSETPILHPRAVLFVATAAQHDALAAALEEYRAMVPSVRGVDADEAAARCPVLDRSVIVGGVLEPDAADIDVSALHAAFQRGLKARGGRIVTNAEVVSMRRDDGRWAVETTAGSFVGDVVVNAAGAWCDVVGAMAGAAPIGLVPKRRTAFTFRPPDDVDPRPWPMVLDVAEEWYFRPEGSRILASPADETPVEPCDVRHEEIDVAIGIERIEAVTTMHIRSIDRAWAGLRSFVADHRPINGWDPEVPGFYWLAGQGGFGIKTSPSMARFAAGVILEGRPPPDLSAAGISIDSVGVARLRA
jgi:D-arginine dehydrogenase